jgi:hypothetical protein
MVIYNCLSQYQSYKVSKNSEIKLFICRTFNNAVSKIALNKMMGWGWCSYDLFYSKILAFSLQNKENHKKPCKLW